MEARWSQRFGRKSEVTYFSLTPKWRDPWFFTVKGGSALLSDALNPSIQPLFWSQEWSKEETVHTVDGWNPANQLRLVVYPIIYKVLTIPGGCLGFLPSTVVSILYLDLFIFAVVLHPFLEYQHLGYRPGLKLQNKCAFLDFAQGPRQWFLGILAFRKLWWVRHLSDPSSPKLRMVSWNLKILYAFRRWSNTPPSLFENVVWGLWHHLSGFYTCTFFGEATQGAAGKKWKMSV